MISLSNLDIKFDANIIIQDGAMIVPDGRIVALIGESGSGKTTLLYVLGLISSQHGYSYSFDGCEIAAASDSVKSAYRKRRIGYVFQDNNLIDGLTIFENILLSANLAHINLTKSEVKELLDYVGINANLDSYPMQLSGGERQRVAIACALAKKPDLIIADEPTSALDSKNAQMIMAIFQKIAHSENKKIVIATHDSFVSSQVDIIYKIESKHIVPSKGISEQYCQAGTEDDFSKENILPQNKKLGLNFYLKYAKSTKRKSKIRKRIMMWFCSIAIAFAVLSTGFGEHFIQTQKSYMDDISNREIFLVNQTAPVSRVSDCDENISISNDKAEKLSIISEIDKIFPYYEFKSSGYVTDFSTKGIIYNGEEEFVFDTSGSNSNYLSYSVVPYVPEQSINNKAEKLDDSIDDGVYLSAALAEALGIDTLNNTTLTIDVHIPIKQFSSEMNMNDISYSVDLDMHKKDRITVKVDGILSSNIYNTKSTSGDNIIYMPFSQMDEIRKANESINISLENPNFPEKKWGASAYIIIAKNYDVVNIVIEKVENIDPNFKIDSPYQNFEAMQDSVSSIQNAAKFISIVVLLILFVLMAIIYMNLTENRKFEICILKANGLKKTEINNLIYIDALIQVIKTFLISSAFSIAIGFVTNKFLFGTDVITFSPTVFGLLLLVSFLSILPPTIIELLIINKFNPDRIMRN
jgi:ABC-type lipoprotein export system ATPase subunit/ABC-type antimicrobial peptide transport system permease subunit